MTVSRLPIRSLHTISEILSQPEIWRGLIASLPADSAYASFVANVDPRKECLFVGCGTSYYLAEAAATIWTLVTGRRARAVPASEVLLFPDTIHPSNRDLQAIVISRSGKTSEAVRAAENLSDRGVRTLGLTCVPGSEITQACDSAMAIPVADEQSLVMTRSFTAMLLVLTELAASLNQKADYSAAINAVSSRLAAVIHQFDEKIESFAAAYTFEDYIYLGQGPYFPIAREGSLKITEMSCSYAQAYHTLEFRHGPKSVVGPQTCLTFFLSEAGMQAESEVLAEMQSLGARIIGVCNRPTELVRQSCDLLFELGVAAPEPVLVAASVVPAQLLGFHTAIKKGLNPDEPKNLSRVVILA